MQKYKIHLLFLLATSLVILSTLLTILVQVKADQPIHYDLNEQHLVVDILSDSEEKIPERITNLVVNNHNYAVSSLWLKPDQLSMSGKENFTEFYFAEQKLYEAVSNPSYVITESGKKIALSFHQRKLSDYPIGFWLNRIEAAMMMLFSLWIFYTAPKGKGAKAVLYGSFGLGIAYLVSDTTISRVWAVPLGFLKSYIILSELCCLLAFSCIFYLAWHLPKPLVSCRLGKYIPTLVAVFLCVSYALFRLEILIDLALAFEFPYLLVITLAVFILIYKFVYYFVHRTDNIIEWTAMRWTMLATFFGVSIPLACHFMIYFDMMKNIPSYAFDSVVIFQIGLSALVVTSVIYRVESLWWRLWVGLCVLGTVILLFFILSELLKKPTFYAWFFALLGSGVIGFLVQWHLKSRYSLTRIELLDNILPKLINVTSLQVQSDILRDTLVERTSEYWCGVLNQAFKPARCNRLHSSMIPKDFPEVSLQTEVEVVGSGQILCIVDTVSDQRILLAGAYNGMRLFNKQDVELVEYFWNIFQQSLHAAESYLKGERDERRRIAADLHDDIGGKLLHLTAGKGHYGKYAQDTLHDLRLLAHGLSSDSKTFENVVGDINYALAEKCDLQDVLFQSNIKLANTAKHVIPARAATMLTSICHELLRNALRHDQVSQISLVIYTRLSQSTSENDYLVTLSISNDGIHTDPALWIKGVGISKITHRITHMEGDITWMALPQGGVICQLCFSLSSWRSL